MFDESIYLISGCIEPSVYPLGDSALQGAEMLKKDSMFGFDTDDDGI